MTSGPAIQLKLVKKNNARPRLGRATAWWFRIKHPRNGKIIAHSEQYASKRARDNAVDLLLSTGGDFKVVDEDGK